MPRPTPDPLWLMLRLAAGSLVAAVPLVGLAWLWHPPDIRAAAEAGIAAALVGAWLGNLPPAFLLGGTVHRQAGGALAGLGVRFFATALLALYLSEATPAQSGARTATLAWLGVAQLVFLGVDVAHQIRLVRCLSAGDR